MSAVSKFAEAVRQNDLDGARTLLEKQPDLLNRKWKLRVHPIHEATSPEMVALLISYGASVDQISDRKTPLHSAAENGRATVVRSLIAAGARPTAHREGKTVELIEKCDEGMQVRFQSCGETPMHFAATVEVVNALFEGGAENLEVRDTWGQTPLMHAAHCGRTEVCEALIQLGSIVDAINNAGETSLIKAVSSNQLAVVSLLLRFGANPSTASAKHWQSTPLHIAAGRDFISIMETLIAANADVNKRDARGRLPLQTANSERAKKILLQLTSRDELGLDGRIRTDAIPNPRVDRMKLIDKSTGAAIVNGCRIAIVDFVNGKLLRWIQTPHCELKDIAVMSSGDFTLPTKRDHDAVMYWIDRDLLTAKQEFVFPNKSECTAIAVSHSRHFLVVATCSEQIWVVDSQRLTIIDHCTAGEYCDRIRISDDGRRIAVAARQSRDFLIVFEFTNNRLIEIASFATDSRLGDFCFSRDGNWIYFSHYSESGSFLERTAEYSTTLEKRHVNTMIRSWIAVYRCDSSQIQDRMAIACNDDVIVVASVPGKIIVRSALSGDYICDIDLPNSEFLSELQFDEDSTHLVVSPVNGLPYIQSLTKTQG